MISAPPIGFEYRASRWLMLALLVMAVLAIVAIFSSGLPFPWQLALLLAVGAGTGLQLHRMWRPPVRTMLWRADGSVQLQLHGWSSDPRREVMGRVHASNVAGPLITLKLRWPQRGRATLWLLPDNLDGDTRRRLRMRLGGLAEDSSMPDQ